MWTYKSAGRLNGKDTATCLNIKNLQRFKQARLFKYAEPYWLLVKPQYEQDSKLGINRH